MVEVNKRDFKQPAGEIGTASGLHYSIFCDKDRPSEDAKLAGLPQAAGLDPAFTIRFFCDRDRAPEHTKLAGWPPRPASAASYRGGLAQCGFSVRVWWGDRRCGVARRAS